MHLQTSSNFHQTPNMAFKTSNPNIFPSLNPMGSFYKQHKTVRSPPIHQDVVEPVKKQKLNNGLEEVIIKQNSELCTMKKNEECRHIGSWVDKDGFSLPKLPKRLNAQNKAKESLETSKAKSFEEVKAVSLDSLVMPDCVMKDFKEIRQNLMNMDQRKEQTKTRKTQKLSKTQKETQKSVLEARNQEKLSQALNPAFLATFYEKLRLDYYVLFLKQNIQRISLMQENMRNQCYQFPSQNMGHKMTSNYIDHSIDERIPEEGLKQEIEC